MVDNEELPELVYSITLGTEGIERIRAAVYRDYCNATVGSEKAAMFDVLEYVEAVIKMARYEANLYQE